MWALKKHSSFLPSFTCLAFLIQSVRCLTKSKKKSPSGTLMTWRTRKPQTEILSKACVSKTISSLYTNHKEKLFLMLISASQMIVTLSVIFTKRLKPSEDLSRRRPEMLWQKSLALVLDSTSNTCQHKQAETETTAYTWNMYMYICTYIHIYTCI